jgi:hypothetical protein
MMIGMGKIDKTTLDNHKKNLTESIKLVQNELKDSIDVQTK